MMKNHTSSKSASPNISTIATIHGCPTPWFIQFHKIKYLGKCYQGGVWSCRSSGYELQIDGAIVECHYHSYKGKENTLCSRLLI